jgi:hypothetical protein
MINPEKSFPEVVASPVAEALLVQQGTLLAYRMYDVADEIDLHKALELNKEASSRLKLSREGSHSLEMPNPPVAFVLGPRTIKLASSTVQATLVAKLFDHGAVSVQLQIPISPGTSLEELVGVSDGIFDDPELDRLARAEVEALCRSLNGALQSPHTWEGSESYHVVFIERFQRQVAAAELLARPSLARLLIGERGDKPVSESERSEVTRQAFSYLIDDLTVVDWNCAFVYEPSSSRDIPDLLEIASAQLMEMRYYDALLDRELARIYDEIDHKRGRFRSLFRSNYGELRRQLTVLMLEVAEFTERVDNSLKIVGDFYLAKVYRAALHRFGIAVWQQSVDRKEALVAQIYDLLKGEVEHGRMFLLEVTVVFLIAIEIVMAIPNLIPH